MKQGQEIWFRDPLRGEMKKRGVLEFEKGDEVVVTFDDYEYLCVFNKSQIVDAPSEFEIEAQEVNHLLNSLYDEARGQDWNFHRLLDEKGYKLVKADNQNETNQPD